MTVRIFHLGDGQTARAVVPTLGGDVAATFEARRDGNGIRIERMGAPRPWRVALDGRPPIDVAGSHCAIILE